MTDRRTFVQQHTLQDVSNAIESTIFGSENKQIMRGLFIDCKTYEQQAEDSCLSLRGLHKRVHKIYPNMEHYLKKLN